MIAMGAELMPGLPLDDPTGLRSWLADRDVPCPACGYNLRRLASDHCLECGRELRLGVSAVEPFLRAWLSLLVAVLLPAGTGLVLFVALGYAVATAGLWPLMRDGWQLPVGPTLVLLHVMGSVPVSILTPVGRRRLLRWPRPTQAGVATAAWAALAGSVLYLLTRIF